MPLSKASIWRQAGKAPLGTKASFFYLFNSRKKKERAGTKEGEGEGKEEEEGDLKVILIIFKSHIKKSNFSLEEEKPSEFF